MIYTIDWDVKDTGALALLKGARISTLIAYALHADDFGNAWCSSNSERPGALNKITGLSHDAIAGKGGARAFLLAHGCIEIVPRETVKQLYGDRPVHRQPSPNADVYHVTCLIAYCPDPQCECRKILQVTGRDMYVFSTSKKNRQEVESITTKTQGSSIDQSLPSIFRAYEGVFGTISPTSAQNIEDLTTEYGSTVMLAALDLCKQQGARTQKYLITVLKDLAARAASEPAPLPAVEIPLDLTEEERAALVASFEGRSTQ